MNIHTPPQRTIPTHQHRLLRTRQAQSATGHDSNISNNNDGDEDDGGDNSDEDEDDDDNEENHHVTREIYATSLKSE